jgi:DNA-binding MarR family transcriptional regulator
MTTRLSACACIRLRRASRAVTQLYDDALAPVHLRVSQYALLSTLAREGRQTISSLAERLLLDRTALSRTLDPLVERSLVVITPGEDARTREVAISQEGRALVAKARPCWAEAQARVEERLGADQAEALVALLAQLETLHPARAGSTETHP